MPNRMIRDYTRSKSVDDLSVHAEVLMLRIFTQADDHGLFYADPVLIKAYCFPRRVNKIKDKDLISWIKELSHNNIITLYEVDEVKYLKVNDFRQRLDKARAKFPLPPEGLQPVTFDNDNEQKVVQKQQPERKTFIPPTLKEVEDYFVENGYMIAAAAKAYKYYDTAKWHDSKGSPVKNWKQKMISVWFKPENLAPVTHKKYIPTEGDQW